MMPAVPRMVELSKLKLTCSTAGDGVAPPPKETQTASQLQLVAVLRMESPLTFWVNEAPSAVVLVRIRWMFLSGPLCLMVTVLLPTTVTKTFVPLRIMSMVPAQFSIR